jgi:hypothetical protein
MLLFHSIQAALPPVEQVYLAHSDPKSLIPGIGIPLRFLEELRVFETQFSLKLTYCIRYGNTVRESRHYNELTSEGRVASKFTKVSPSKNHQAPASQAVGTGDRNSSWWTGVGKVCGASLVNHRGADRGGTSVTLVL